MKKSRQLQVPSLIFAVLFAPTVFADGFNDWQGAIPMVAVPDQAAPVPSATSSSPTLANYIGRTRASVTVGTGPRAQRTTATGLISVAANFSQHTLAAQLSGFKSGNTDVAKALNAFAPSLSGTFDNSGKFSGKTLVGGVAVGKTSGRVDANFASGNWNLVKNEYSVNGSFVAKKTSGKQSK